MWSSNVSKKYELVELFSGAGNVGKVFRPYVCALTFASLSGKQVELWGSTIGTIPGG